MDRSRRAGDDRDRAAAGGRLTFFEEETFVWEDTTGRATSRETAPAGHPGGTGSSSSVSGSATSHASGGPGAGAPGGTGAGGRVRGGAHGRRRRTTAGAALLAMLLGFFVAGLLDVGALQRDAEGMPIGAKRSTLLVLLKPMTTLSGATGLDRPGRDLDVALGRTGAAHHSITEVRKAEAKPLWPRAVTPARPLALYIAGDSMAQTFGSSLVNLAEETGLVEAKLDYHVSTGLSRPDYFDWPQRFVDKLVEYEPDAVVVMFGANDGQDVEHQGEVLKVGTKAWQRLYRRRVGEAMTILTSGGRRVYWVGNPIMRDAGYRDRISMMDRIYAAEAKEHRGVNYVSTWALMADEKGSYAEYLSDGDGDSVLMRHEDGIHLSRAGADRMAGAVLDVIARDWGMEL